MVQGRIVEVELDEEIEQPDGSAGMAAAKTVNDYTSYAKVPDYSSLPSYGVPEDLNIHPIQNDEQWVKTLWRPAIAWSYVLICLFDFIIGPVLTMIFFHHPGAAYVQWQPLTLQGAGLYHMAMGAIVGVTAWSRGQEKIKGVGY